MSSTLSSIQDFPELLRHEIFMRRCLQLAGLGAANTSPNPMVGAVLVDDGRIIGEGYHEKHGEPHAEVNCLKSVKAADRPRIPFSTLYVSLEPCCHHGKTPPCTEMIIREKIPAVVIGCRDPYLEVNGKGIEILRANGVGLEYPVLENQAKETNRRFFTYHQKKRPYIILKWAQSANQKMAGTTGERIRISNDYSNRLVHKWRSEEAAILIGTNTVLLDNPELTTRLWTGKNPVRIALDKELRLPGSLKIFDGLSPTIVLNYLRELHVGNLLFKKIDAAQPFISSISSALHSLHLLSVLVEGGPKLLLSFINSGEWDEIRIITNQTLELEGLSSPEFKDASFINSEDYGSDRISYFRNSMID
jgi:diaminohydroxyphosphoribosylaminopyrimidine deaminase / 5-amino-6-(5-phosphoribosylamino)uracil reductase